MLKSVVLSLALLVGITNGFSITKHQPAKAIRVKEGDSFLLMCTMDGYYEWCTFEKGPDKCDFEWKRSAWNVTMQECQPLQNKIAFQGNYESHECGVKILSAKIEDSGTWTCDVEEYVKMGSRGSGAKAKHSFSVTVYPATTTTTPASTLTTTITDTTTTTESTTTTLIEYPEETEEEDYSDGDYYPEPAVTNHTLPSVDEYDTETASLPGNATQAEEYVAEEDDNMNAGLPVGLSICIIVLFATVVTLFGLHYKRRLHPCFYSMVQRPWKPVMTDFPVTAEDEAKNHPTIIKTSSPDQSDISMRRLEEETMNITADLTSVSWINEDKPEVNNIEEVEDKTQAPTSQIVEKDTEASDPTEVTPLQNEANDSEK